METKTKEDVEPTNSVEPAEPTTSVEKNDEVSSDAETVVVNADSFQTIDDTNSPDDCMYYDNTSVFIKSYFKKLADRMPERTKYYNKIGRLMAINDPDDEDFDPEMFDESFNQIYRTHYKKNSTEHDAAIGGAESALRTIEEESVAGPSKPAKNSFLDFAR